MLFLTTSYNDNEANIFDESDIEEKTAFSTIITDWNSNQYHVKGRLWKPKNKELILLYKFDQSTIIYDCNLYFNDISFYYKATQVNIHFSYTYFYARRIDSKVPFLYGNEQTINLEDDKESYFLNFKIDEYNNEILMLTSNEKENVTIILDKCFIEQKDLKCRITKSKIIEIAKTNNQIYKLNVFADYRDNYKFKIVFDIHINYKTSKENIYVGIKNLCEDSLNRNYYSYIAYETNITDILNIHSGAFSFIFRRSTSTSYTYSFNCNFKKTKDNPLLFICYYTLSNYYQLHIGQSNKEYYLDNINIKYNFIIPIFSNSDTFSFYSKGSFVRFSYPNILDFTKQETYNIEYWIESPNYLKDIKLDENSGSLECDYIDKIKTCVVPKSHFTQNKTGYYDTYSSDKRLYELSPVKVIFDMEDDNNIEIKIRKENNKITIEKGKNGPIVLNTDYNDYEKKIFNDKEIEEDTKFNSTITDQSDNKYEVTCKLWNTKEQNIRIICNLNESLKEMEKYHYIHLNEVKFEYSNYNISISQIGDLEVYESEYDTPFLYYEPQMININNNDNLYYLNFKIENYNNELLYIYGQSENNYAILDKCQKTEKKLKCEIKKEVLEETLTINGEIFKVGAIDDNRGLIDLENIFDIQIFYKDIQKEDIYLELTGFISSTNEVGVPVGIETNIVNIPNLITDTKDGYYFKKVTGGCLTLFIKYSSEGTYSLSKFQNSIGFTNIHYKYNFRVNPINWNDEIRIIGSGSDIKYIYSEILDFKGSDSKTIRYIMSNPSNIKNIKLDPESFSSLSCSDLYKMKKCTVSKDHFTDKYNGYFYTYHSNDNNITLKYNDFAPIQVIFPEEDTIVINIEKEDNEDTIYIGKKQLFYFVTNYIDTENIFDVKDIEEKTVFIEDIFDKNDNKYNISCRLWKPINDKIRILCTLDNEIKEEIKVSLNPIRLNYNNHKIKIMSYLNYFTIVKNYKTPFLYSDQQIISFEEGKETYEIKFKIEEYYDESLILKDKSYIFLKKCSKNGEELICTINKNDIAEILAKNEQKFKLIYINEDNDLKEFKTVLDIVIKYDNIKKEDIYIGINKINDLNINKNNYISYETNITSLPNMISGEFTLLFNKVNNNLNIGVNDNIVSNVNCKLIKTTEKPLLIICKMNDEGSFSLGKIDNEIKLEDINYKYNFLISKVDYNDEFTISGTSTSIIFAYPKELDLNSTKEAYIEYFIENPLNIHHIRLNPGSNDLICEYLGSSIVRCLVNRSHFENFISGYYYTFHSNSNYDSEQYLKFYELPPIRVTLPENDEIILRIKPEQNKNNNITLSSKGSFMLITNYNDEERNIFKDNIEKSTQFDSEIIIGYDNFSVNCRLWKVNNENIRIIFKLQRSVSYYSYLTMSLKEVSFNYYQYRITIIPEYKVNINYNSNKIPFLYSPPQIINIDDEHDKYYLNFKVDTYFNELLLLRDNSNNYALLDKCKFDGKVLKCELSKQKLEEQILILNNKKYNVVAINDNIGIIKFNYIYPININYKNVIKEDIYIQVGKLIGNIATYNLSIGFETNITNIPNLLSDTFTLNGYNCYFRKSKDKPLILYFKISSGTYEPNWKIEEEKIFNKIHYKYNFRIQPFENGENIEIRQEKGVEIKFMYPSELNFLTTSQQTIIYILSGNQEITLLKLDPDGNSRECKDFNGIKKCEIYQNDFINQTSGYYNTYFAFSYNYYFYKIYDITPINITFPEEPDESDEPDEKYDGYIDIYINKRENGNILKMGSSGGLYFITNYTDNESFFDASTIEEKISFENAIYKYYGSGKYDYNIIYATCRLWKPKDKILRVLCDYSSSSYSGNEISFRNISFVYNKYYISIRSNARIRIEQMTTSIPFLYSDLQTINIENSKFSYDLQFKIGKYTNDEMLILHIKQKGGFSYIILDNCNNDGRNIKCIITRDKLEVMLINKTEILALSYYDTSLYDIITLDYIFDIKINYENIHKEDIKVEITKLLTSSVGLYDKVVYETNVNSINNVTSDFFNFAFNNSMDSTIFTCFFKKIKDHPLYLFCQMTYDNGKYYIGEINEVVRIDNINIRYNFLIQPTTNYEAFYNGNYIGGYILYSYPTTLNFYSKQTETIYYLISGNINENQFYIKLNLDSSSDILCRGSSSYSRNLRFMSCTIPKSHFNGKKDGNYYTYFRNIDDYNNHGYTKYYEQPPVQVVLPKDTDIFIKIASINSIIGTKGIIIFITDYNDNEKDIFKNKNVESIQFKTQIYINYYYYDANCRLWNPVDENLRIICNVNVKYSYASEVSVRFVEYRLTQDKYTFYISQAETQRGQFIDYDLALLYSERQIINIEDNKDSYNLKFKVESYNNEIIGLCKTREPYSSRNYTTTFAVMDSCQLNNKELNCKISKSKLEEILTNNNGLYIVGTVDEKLGYGLIPQENILGVYINYNIIIKKTIYVGITRLLSINVELNTPFGFETNITDIENLNTDQFNQNGYYYYFKKLAGKPLLLLTKTSYFTTSSYIWPNNQEIIQSKIHYKYIFRIQPFNGDTNINTLGTSSTEIMLTYPEELDFRNEDTITLRYVMNSSSSSGDIRLNPDAPYIKCTDTKSNLIKICNVPLSHFIGKKSGIYRTYHGNSVNENYEASLIKVTIPEDKFTFIYIRSIENYQRINLGRYGGIIYFGTNYTDNDNIFNSNNIEDNTRFETAVIDNNYNNYFVTCRLWKPLDKRIRILCRLDKSISSSVDYIRLSSGLVNYNNKKIAIINLMTSGVRINYKSNTVPFLYSDQQTINIEQSKETYELRFKYDYFSSQKLYLIPAKNYYYSHIMFDNCKIESQYVVCEFQREKIEEILGYSGDNFVFGYYDSHDYSLINFDYIFGIKINYNNVKKENIYINITRLLYNNVGYYAYIAYVTNITSMPDIVSYEFELEFNGLYNLTCFFKKAIERPLILLCKARSEFKSLYLGEIKKEIILNNIHYKYNLLIQPVVNKEEFIIQYQGSSLLYVYPKTLDFYYKNSYTIYYFSNEYYGSINAIGLMENNKLLCNVFSNKYISCTVSRDYFLGMSSGYYTTFYSNNYIYSPSYELSPIEIILPKRNEEIIKVKPSKTPVIIGKNGAILLEVDYNRDKINIKELEKLVNFKANFSSDDKIYEAVCKEWTPEYGSIKMICRFKENLNTNEIRLDKFTFDYENIKIVLLSEKFSIKQSDKTVALLYNDRQVVNIDNSFEGKIKLQKGVYNSETLLLQNGMKNIKLTCQDETDEVTCTLNKDKLNQILSYSGERFTLYQMIDSEGILKFDYVEDIIFNYTDTQKQDIYIDIKKILSTISQKNSFIVYETNITSVSQITTDYFYIYSYSNGIMRCMFKKIGEKLLFLCNTDDIDSSRFSLGKIDNMIIEDDNIFYRFNIKETENTEFCAIENYDGAKIFMADYPNEFDFTSKLNYTVRYLADKLKNLNGITFNENSRSGISCSTKNEFMECVVEKVHFSKSGNYYTYYEIGSNYNNKMIAYEVPSIKVILSENEKKEEDKNSEGNSYAGVIAGCVIGGIILIALIVFLVWRFYKRKNSGDDSSGKQEELIELKNE